MRTYTLLTKRLKRALSVFVLAANFFGTDFLPTTILSKSIHFILPLSEDIEARKEIENYALSEYVFSTLKVLAVDFGSHCHLVLSHASHCTVAYNSLYTRSYLVYFNWLAWIRNNRANCIICQVSSADEEKNECVRCPDTTYIYEFLLQIDTYTSRAKEP